MKADCAEGLATTTPESKAGKASKGKKEKKEKKEKEGPFEGSDEGKGKNKGREDAKGKGKGKGKVPESAAPFLLATPAANGFDSELDAMFNAAPSAPALAVASMVATRSTAASSHAAKTARAVEEQSANHAGKRKRSADSSLAGKAATKRAETANAPKRARASGPPTSDSDLIDKDESEEESDDGSGEESDDALERMYAIREAASAATKAKKATVDAQSSGEVEEDEDVDDDDSGEGAAEVLSSDDGELQSEPASDDEVVEATSDDEQYDASAPPPVHESLRGKPSTSERLVERAQSLRQPSSDEPKELKDKRTLFVGNLPIEAVTSKAVSKELRRHLLALSPQPDLTKIENLRYRSVPFSTPTDDFGAENDEEAATKAKRRERSARFREAMAAADGEAGGNAASGKTLLNPKQKRKIAFINKDLNQHADFVNAYVTISHPPEATEDSARRFTAPVLAALLSAAADGSVFQGRHLRVDLVKPLEPAEVLAAGLDKMSTADGTLIGSSTAAADPKRTVFVGNLDFEASEEELRAFFEALLREERGDPPVSTAPSDEDLGSTVARPAEWVRSIRIVRDRATQMGKGFAYVRFIDTACVDEVLAISEAEEAVVSAARSPVKNGKGQAQASARVPGEQSFKRRLKFRKRPLRVSRCKNNSTRPSPAKRTAGASDGPSTPVRDGRRAPYRARSSGAPTPGGSSPFSKNRAAAYAAPASPTPRAPRPDIGARLAGLDKEARAAIKRADPERNSRRLDKKRAKQAAARVNQDVGDANKARMRIRKPKPNTGKGSGPKKSFSKAKHGKRKA